MSNSIPQRRTTPNAESSAQPAQPVQPLQDNPNNIMRSIEAQNQALRQIYGLQTEMLEMMKAQQRRARNGRIISIIVNVLIWVVIPIVLVAQLMKTLPSILGGPLKQIEQQISLPGTNLDLDLNTSTGDLPDAAALIERGQDANKLLDTLKGQLGL